MKYILTFILISVLFSCQQKTKEKLLTHSEITVLLDSIHDVDQQQRNKIQNVFNQYGRESEEFMNAFYTLNRVDSLNTIQVTKILDTYGWLGAKEIGSKANSTLFLVIQHATKEVRQKYLPMLKDAVEEHKASKQNYALMYDRLNLELGKPQLYGSQVKIDDNGKTTLLPLIDADKVDERRKEMGLGPLAEYLSYYDIDWNVEEYMKQYPKDLEDLKQSKL